MSAEKKSGWVTTRITCAVCARQYTVTHPFDSPTILCPDCGYLNAVDQGVRL